MSDPYETIPSLEAQHESTIADCERIIVAVEKLTAALGVPKTWDEAKQSVVEILIAQLDAATERVRVQKLLGFELE